jgi:hypothetical protein
VLGWIRDLVRTTRMIGNQYPAALGECRTINDSIQKIQQKVMMSQPAPEPMSPPV